MQAPERAETLAEAFLADFESEEDQEEPLDTAVDHVAPDQASGEEVMAQDPADVVVVEQLVESEKLFGDLHAFLGRIDSLNNTSCESSELGKGNPEYDTIVEAANMTASIEEGIIFLHKKVRDLYSKKFPELESVVVNPLDYVRAVQAIGNLEDFSLVDLSDILPGAIAMSISITATHSAGTMLSDSDMKQVESLCHRVFTLEQASRKILSFVEARMHIIAPNLSELVGSAIAAKLMGIAGGLDALSQIPACNIQRLGTQRKTLSGFSTSTTQIHTGVINDCDLVKTAPMYLRPKVRRLVANKCALVARTDMYKTTPDAALGTKLKAQIQKKIQKEQEPPPPKAPKPLRAPDDHPKKRRGGRRARRLKEKYAMTEVRKQANRLAFGLDAEESYGLTTKGFGMLGKAGSGKVRITSADRPSRKRPRKALHSGTRTSTKSVAPISGLSSSLAFTPVQGFELKSSDTEEAREAQAKANAKYFSGTSGFLKVNKKNAAKQIHQQQQHFAVPAPRPVTKT